MTYVMQLVSIEGEPYLESYDPDYVPDPPEPQYPNGKFEATTDVDKAMRFDSPAEAMLLWKAVSTTVPTRPDGKPNRPLSALTVRVEPLDE